MQEFELTLKLKTRTMRKINKTGPGTARRPQSVLEPEPEPPRALGQFQNLNCFGMSVPTLRIKSILFGCVSGKI